MTPLQRSAFLAALKAGLSLPDAAKQTGLTAAEVRRQMAADGPAGEALSRDVAAAVAVGERVAAPAEWTRVAALPAERRTGTGVGYPAPSRGSGGGDEDEEDENALDLEGFRERARMRYGEGRGGLLFAQDERLVAAGYPAMTPWWRWTFESFFESERTWLLATVGRGAGKSTFLERLLLIIILFTERTVPPNQIYQAPFLSVLPEDARRRLDEIQGLLKFAYSHEAKVKNNALPIKDISGNDIELVSLAGTVGRVSGPSTVSAIFDEAAKLHTAAGAANRDSELIASIVGTSRLLPGWTGVRCSSAWETRGAHFLSCLEGTNEVNFVATIGPDFIDAALDGLESVARWEASQGRSHEAAQIRAHARTLDASSPYIPTWVARPAQSALQLRMMLDTMPKEDPGLEGLTRSQYFLREYASMPLSRESGFDPQAGTLLAGEMMARLAELRGGPRRVAPTGDLPPMKVATALPGDARYAGPVAQRRGTIVGGDWRKRRSI